MKLLPAFLIILSLSCNSGDGNNDRRDQPVNDRNREERDREYNNDRDRNRTEGNDMYPDSRERPDRQPENNSNESDQLMSLVEKYNRYLKNENWIGVVNMHYPDIAGGQEKTQVAQEYGARFHNEVYDLVTDRATVEHVSEIINVDGDQFAIATGTGVGTLNVKEDAFGDKRAKSNFFNNLCDTYVKENGQQNVKCDESRGYMNVTMKSTCFLLKTKKYNEWYIITKGDKENVKKYIPQSVQDRVR